MHDHITVPHWFLLIHNYRGRSIQVFPYEETRETTRITFRTSRTTYRTFRTTSRITVRVASGGLKMGKRAILAPHVPSAHPSYKVFKKALRYVAYVQRPGLS